MKTKTIFISILLASGLFVACLSLFTGCGCTKRDCATMYPFMTIKIKPYAYATILRVDRSTNMAIDSCKQDFQPVVQFDNWYAFTKTSGAEIGAYNYVIRTSLPSSDTLYNITYKKSVTAVACNSCGLSNQYEDITTYQNFTYKHKGKEYRDIDTLVLGK